MSLLELFTNERTPEGAETWIAREKLLQKEGEIDAALPGDWTFRNLDGEEESAEIALEMTKRFVSGEKFDSTDGDRGSDRGSARKEYRAGKKKEYLRCGCRFFFSCELIIRSCIIGGYVP